MHHVTLILEILCHSKVTVTKVRECTLFIVVLHTGSSIHNTILQYRQQRSYSKANYVNAIMSDVTLFQFTALIAEQ